MPETTVREDAKLTEFVRVRLDSQTSERLDELMERAEQCVSKSALIRLLIRRGLKNSSEDVLLESARWGT